MANSRRRPIAPVRKVIAGVLGTFASFVSLFGLGMGNWIIVALGGALLVLAISMVAVTVVRSGARAWVTGVGHVHTVSEIPASSKFGRCEMQIVIDAPGLPPRSIKIRDPRVPVDKWPRPGTMLPIMVAFDDQRHVRILWDDVPTHAEAEAAAHAAGFDTDYLDDPLTEEILIEQQPPPWAQRGPDDDFLSPADDILASDSTATTADLTDQLADMKNEPVIVHQTQNGGLILEGTVVEHPSVVPLPRRSRPEPTETDPVPFPEADEISPASADEIRDSAGAAQEEKEEERTGSTKLDHERGLRRDVIHGVGITVLVADLSRSLAFYRDRLGFVEVDGGADNAVLTSGSTRLVLRAVPDIAPANRRLVHINLEVDDVHAAYEELSSSGVRFTYAPRPFNLGSTLEQWTAAFRDPDGHGVALTQWLSR